jgi:hypothetical protein
MLDFPGDGPDSSINANVALGTEGLTGLAEGGTKDSKQSLA